MTSVSGSWPTRDSTTCISRLHMHNAEVPCRHEWLLLSSNLKLHSLGAPLKKNILHLLSWPCKFPSYPNKRHSKVLLIPLCLLCTKAATILVNFNSTLIMHLWKTTRGL